MSCAHIQPPYPVSTTMGPKTAPVTTATSAAPFQSVPNAAQTASAPDYPPLGPSSTNGHVDKDISVCFSDSPCSAVLMFSNTIFYPFRYCGDDTHDDDD